MEYLITAGALVGVVLALWAVEQFTRRWKLRQLEEEPWEPPKEHSKKQTKKKRPQVAQRPHPLAEMGQAMAQAGVSAKEAAEAMTRLGEGMALGFTKGDLSIITSSTKGRSVPRHITEREQQYLDQESKSDKRRREWVEAQKEKTLDALTPKVAHELLRRLYCRPTMLGDPIMEEPEVFRFRGVTVPAEVVFDLADQYEASLKGGAHE